MNKQKDLRIYSILLIYFLAVSLTFVDKLDFINNYDWGLKYDYWFDNSTYLRSNLFWFNLFLLSLAPVFFIRYFKASKAALWPALALPFYWLYLLFLSMTDTGNSADLLIPGVNPFIYGVVAISGVFVVIKIIMLNASIRKEKKIETLEKFKERALKKLSRLNPEVNPALLEDVLGEWGVALTMLKAASVENDPEIKHDLTRAALHYAAGGEESMEQLQKRLTRLSTIDTSSDPKDGNLLS